MRFSRIASSGRTGGLAGVVPDFGDSEDFASGLGFLTSSLGSAVVTDPVSLSPIQLQGRTLPLAPEWTFSLGGQYRFVLGNGASITPRVDYSYIASQWATPYQDFGDFLPSRNLVNAQIEYAEGPYKVTLFGANVFNLHYVIATNIGLRYAGDPAQYGIRVERAF